MTDTEEDSVETHEFEDSCEECGEAHSECVCDEFTSSGICAECGDTEDEGDHDGD